VEIFHIENCWYCSGIYTKTLTDNGIAISMMKNGDPLENALAERMNRIFKDNFALDQDFADFDTAQSIIDVAIHYYNNRLPHSSIDMLTPSQAQWKIGTLKKHYRWY